MKVLLNKFTIKLFKTVALISIFLICSSRISYASSEVEPEFPAINKLTKLEQKFATIVDVPEKIAGSLLYFSDIYIRDNILSNDYKVPELFSNYFKSRNEFYDAIMKAKRFDDQESYIKLFAYASKEANFLAAQSKKPLEKKKLQDIANYFNDSENNKRKSDFFYKKGIIFQKFADDARLRESYESYLQNKYGKAFYKVIANDTELCYVEIKRFLKIKNIDIII